MTSVQNLQPRLSGNKFLALLSAFVLISCNAFKVISNDNTGETKEEQPVVVDENKPEDEPTKSDTKSKPKNESKRTSTVEFFGEKYQVEPHKTEFRVALILPFYFNAESRREQLLADAMLEYYQGVKMALNDLENQGLRMKLFVYDNENDEKVLMGILDKSIMRQMDVIVGPLGQSHVELVSDFGLKHDVNVISPFTGIEEVKKANGRLYSATPSYTAKAQRFVDFVKTNYPEDKVIILSDKKSYAKTIEPLVVSGLIEAGMSYSVVDGKANWGQLLTPKKNTVVYVVSHKPTMVNTTLSNIYRTKRDVTVFGENSWSDFDDNDYNFWSKMNIHLIATDFVNDTMTSVRTFRQNFRLVNKDDPGLYAYLGYDQFKFMGDFLMAFGEHFPLYINEKEFRYLGSNYNYHFSNGLNQNSNVFILKFEEYELKPTQ